MESIDYPLSGGYHKKQLLFGGQAPPLHLGGPRRGDCRGPPLSPGANSASGSKWSASRAIPSVAPQLLIPTPCSCLLGGSRGSSILGSRKPSRPSMRCGLNEWCRHSFKSFLALSRSPPSSFPSVCQCLPLPGPGRPTNLHSPSPPLPSRQAANAFRSRVQDRLLGPEGGDLLLPARSSSGILFMSGLSLWAGFMGEGREME